MSPHPPGGDIGAVTEPGIPLLAGTIGAREIQDDGIALRCHVCGRFYVNLARHARLTHSLSADDYRERFGLNRGTPLVSPVLARRALLAPPPRRTRSW